VNPNASDAATCAGVRGSRWTGSATAVCLIIRLSFEPIAYQAAPVTRLSQALIAVAWFVSTLGVVSTAGGRAINIGFVAAIVIAFAAACSDWRAFRALPKRAVLPALGLVVLAFCVPALAQGAIPRAYLSAGRGCAALAWFTLVLSLGSRARQPLAWAAVVLLGVNVAIAISSLVCPAHFSAFERVQHVYAAGLPRLRGLANTPAPAGIWALVCVGLAEVSPRPSLRWLARSLGLLEACASLSIALLAVPALIVALLPQRRVRWPLIGCAGFLAAVILYFQPIELSVGGRTIALSRELPEYWSGGLGPEYMPEMSFALPGIALRGHGSAYGALALRGLSCFAQHPLLGVGPGGFHESCRVMAMNTFGEWTDQRDAHNQLGGVLSELGLVGVALLILAWLAWRRGYRFDVMTSWQRAVWTGLLVCSLGSEDLLTLPVLALLASQLTPRKPWASS
jgi:hypothetical protein